METKFKYIMPSSEDYNIIKNIIEPFDNDDNWPVEEYDEEENIIEIDYVTAQEDDVIELALTLEKLIKQLADKVDDKVAKERLLACSFVIEGFSEDKYGSSIDYIIERKNQKVTIQETPWYTFHSSDYYEDYENFCDDNGDLCSEDEFDSESDIYIVGDKVFFDEAPTYGEKIDIKDYSRMRTGVVYPINDDIITYFKENNIPYDEHTIENLSVDDVYLIMAGTYDKDN